MQVKSIKIGKYTTKNNVFLAPMAGYTDFAFREICASYGAGLTVTELVSSKGLMYNTKGSFELLTLTNNEILRCAQIFGSEPEIMRQSVELEVFNDYQIIDINMGCPVPKLYKNGEGCALLNDLKKAEKIISEVAKSGKEVTVKTRIGLVEGKYTTADFAIMAENAGAKMLTIHGRVREKYYSGSVNYEEIKKAKKLVKIPIIANGGIESVEDATLMQEVTQADGVMIGRGAISKPYIFSQILGIDYKYSVKEVIKTQISKMQQKFSDEYILNNLKKFMPYYFKGIPNSNQIKRNLTLSTTMPNFLEILNTINY